MELYSNTPSFTYVQEILVKFTKSNEKAHFSQGLHREQSVNIQILVRGAEYPTYQTRYVFVTAMVNWNPIGHIKGKVKYTPGVSPGC